jgi:hypothetical protein
VIDGDEKSGAPEPGSAAAASHALARRLAAASAAGARDGELTGPREPHGHELDRTATLPAGASDQAGFPEEVGLEPTPTGRRRGRIALVVAVLLLLLAGLAGSGYLVVSNRDRAERWEDRAFQLERNVDQLNGLLVERSNILNARTGELNRMATKVRRQQGALQRSEADVSSLERRQRALAAEKADVEDSRAQLAVQAAALENVADAFVDCKDGLVDLLNYVLDEDFFSATAVVSGVASDCNYAESALSDYNYSYP